MIEIIQKTTAVFEEKRNNEFANPKKAKYKNPSELYEDFDKLLEDLENILKINKKGA